MPTAGFCLAGTRIWITKAATFGVGLMRRLRAGADEGPAECGLSPLSFQAGQGWPDGIGAYRPLPGGTMRVLPPAAEWLAGPGPLAADEVVSYVASAAVRAASAGRYGAILRIVADQGARATLAGAAEAAERAKRLSSEHVHG